MSDYHILENANKEETKIVFHIDVPNTINSAGMTYSVALVEYLQNRDGTITSKVPWLETAFVTETSYLQSGIKAEHEEFMQFDANLGNGAKRALIDDRFNSLTTIIPNRLVARLRFWHYDRDVP